MAYHDPSTFNSPDPGSWWVIAHDGPRHYLVSSTGYGFVVTLNEVLREKLRAMPRVPVDPAGFPVRWQDLSQTDAWTNATSSALWAVWRARGMAASTLEDMWIEAATFQSPSWVSLGMATGLLLASGRVHAPPGVDLPNLAVIASTSLGFPTIGRVLPASSGGVELTLTPIDGTGAAPPGTPVQPTSAPVSNPSQIPPGQTQPVSTPAATTPSTPSPSVSPMTGQPSGTPTSPSMPDPRTGQAMGKPGTAGPTGGKPPAVGGGLDKPLMAVGEKPSTVMAAVAQQTFAPKPVQTNTGREFAVPPPPPSMQFHTLPTGGPPASVWPSNTTIAIAALAILAIGGVLYAASGSAAPAPVAARQNPRRSRKKLTGGKRRRKTTKPKSRKRTRRSR